MRNTVEANGYGFYHEQATNNRNSDLSEGKAYKGVQKKCINNTSA